MLSPGTQKSTAKHAARRYAQQLVREDGPDERDLTHQRANGALAHAPAPGHVASELCVKPLDAAAQDAHGDRAQAPECLPD